MPLKPCLQLDENAKPDFIEDDWIVNFFEKSRIVSDNEMQELWSRVLSGEANSPGTYSKRTVNFLSDLDKTEAVLFTKFCGFVWTHGDLVALVFDSEAEIYSRNGINFEKLSHLDSIGIIQFNDVTGFRKINLSKSLVLHYYDRPLHFETSSWRRRFLCGRGSRFSCSVGRATRSLPHLNHCPQPCSNT